MEEHQPKKLLGQVCDAIPVLAENPHPFADQALRINTFLGYWGWPADP